MVDDPGGGDAVNRDWLLQSIFLVVFLRDAELVFDPEAVRIFQTNRLVAFGQASFAPADVAEFGALFAPVPAQKVVDARLHSEFEVFDLFWLLILYSLRRAVKVPPF